MVPKNFPGRKNARRLRALERLETGPLASPEGKLFRTPAQRTAEMNTLTLRIMPQDRAGAIRTKKDRSGRGSFKRVSA